MAYSYCSYGVVVLLVWRSRITRIACTLVRVLLVLRVHVLGFDFVISISTLKFRNWNRKVKLIPQTDPVNWFRPQNKNRVYVKKQYATSRFNLEIKIQISVSNFCLSNTSNTRTSVQAIRVIRVRHTSNTSTPYDQIFLACVFTSVSVTLRSGVWKWHH